MCQFRTPFKIQGVAATCGLDFVDPEVLIPQTGISYLKGEQEVKKYQSIGCSRTL